MMTGALKPLLRKSFTASRPSMSGSPTSRSTRSTWPFGASLSPSDALAASIVSNSSCRESCSLKEFAELIIVVDDQDLARIAHWPPPTELPRRPVISGGLPLGQACPLA